MSGNTIGVLFKVTTWGESHGPAVGAVVDGPRPGSKLPRRISRPISTSGVRAPSLQQAPVGRRTE